MKKSFWKRPIVWIVIAGLLMVGAIVNKVEKAVAPKISVPALSGEKADDAAGKLFELGLEYEFETAGGDTVRSPESWVVVSTNPKPGSKVIEGDEISILVKEAKQPIEEKDGVDNSRSGTAKVVVPDIKGQPGDKADEILDKAGLSGSFSSPDESVWMKSNWDVVDTTPKAGIEVESGTTVEVTVKRATERLERESAESDARYKEQAAKTAALPIEEDYAMTFCDDYTDQQYPYGAKNHWITGKLAAEPRDGGWYLKVRSTLTNAYNAEADMNIECHVSGTNGAPKMDQYLVY